MGKLQPEQNYPTDLTNKQWAALEPLFPPQTGPGRPRTIDLRQVINALFYMTRTGCQWEMLPLNFPHWSAVRYYFDKWRVDGTWEQINDRVRHMVREKAGRDPEPGGGIMESQSAKTTSVGGEQSYDGGKKINGRKRSALGDTRGDLLKAVVHPAGDDDRDGAEFVLDAKAGELPRLKLIWVDQKYSGQEFIAWVKDQFGIVLEIAKRVKDKVGFVVLPRRWVVERFFAWLGNYRRLSKDYEYLPESSESWIYLASIDLMRKRLCRGKSEPKPHRTDHHRRSLDYVEDPPLAV